MNQPVEATEAIKKWIDDHRSQQGWSMRETSMKAGLSESYVSQIMRGQAPGIEACAALAKLFAVPTEYVLYLAGYLNRDPSRGVSPELQTLLEALESLKDEPIYEPTLRAIWQVVDIALYKADVGP